MIYKPNKKVVVFFRENEDGRKQILRFVLIFLEREKGLYRRHEIVETTAASTSSTFP